MNGFNDKELQRIWDFLGLPADVSKQEEFERMVYEWRNSEIEPKRIVRCRDCKWCKHAGRSRYECYNGRFAYQSHAFAKAVPAPVAHDGFCAWAEPEEVD